MNVNLFFNITPKEERKSNAVKSGGRAGQEISVRSILLETGILFFFGMTYPQK